MPPQHVRRIAILERENEQIQLARLQSEALCQKCNEELQVRLVCLPEVGTGFIPPLERAVSRR